MKPRSRVAGLVYALQEELGTIRNLVAPEPVPHAVISGLHELLGTHLTLAHGLRLGSSNDSYELPFHDSVGRNAASFTDTFAHYIASQRVRWGAYNPAEPEPAQRNTVVVATADQMRQNRVPAALDLFPRVGLGESSQIRALVCDGPSLLAWVGGWRAEPFAQRERTILASLLPDLQRRLRTVRLLGLPARSPLVSMALDAIGRAAIVVDARGRVLEANAQAREILAREGAGVRRELAEALDIREAHPRWQATRVRAHGEAAQFLVVERQWTPERLALQVDRAAKHWMLTKRQREVLAKVLAGNPNQTVAAMLGIAERTVEEHLRGLFDRTQVDSRAELIVKVFKLDEDPRRS